MTSFHPVCPILKPQSSVSLRSSVDFLDKIHKPGRLLDNNVNQDQADDGYGNQDINQSKQNQN